MTSYSVIGRTTNTMMSPMIITALPMQSYVSHEKRVDNFPCSALGFVTSGALSLLRSLPAASSAPLAPAPFADDDDAVSVVDDRSGNALGRAAALVVDVLAMMTRAVEEAR